MSWVKVTNKHPGHLRMQHMQNKLPTPFQISIAPQKIPQISKRCCTMTSNNNTGQPQAPPKAHNQMPMLHVPPPMPMPMIPVSMGHPAQGFMHPAHTMHMNMNMQLHHPGARHPAQVMRPPQMPHPSHHHQMMNAPNRMPPIPQLHVGHVVRRHHGKKPGVKWTKEEVRK